MPPYALQASSPLLVPLESPDHPRTRSLLLASRNSFLHLRTFARIRLLAIPAPAHFGRSHSKTGVRRPRSRILLHPSHLLTPLADRSIEAGNTRSRPCKAAATDGLFPIVAPVPFYALGKPRAAIDRWRTSDPISPPGLCTGGMCPAPQPNALDSMLAPCAPPDALVG